MNKIGKFTTIVAVAGLLAGCAGGTSGAAPAEGEVTDEKHVIKLGYVDTAGSLVDIAAQGLKRVVEEESDGAIELEIFNGGQLGAETEMVESMALGALDLAIVGDSMISVFAPEFSALSMPYLIEDSDHLRAVSESDIAGDIDSTFRSEVGTEVVDWWFRAPRNVTADRAVENADDLEGMKLRVPTNPVMEKAWSALGANPTPVPFTELFVALQQGVVDGQENPIDLITATKFDEVQSHLMLTEHLFAPYLILLSEDASSTLSDDLKTILQESIEAAGQHLDELVNEGQEENLATLEANGMTIVEPDVESFRTKIDESGVLDELSSDWVPNLVERIRELG